MVQLEAGPDGKVWGVNSKNELYRRSGVSAAVPMGTSWMKIGGMSLKFVTVGKDQLYSIDIANMVFSGTLKRVGAGQSPTLIGGPGSLPPQKVLKPPTLIGGVSPPKMMMTIHGNVYSSSIVTFFPHLRVEDTFSLTILNWCFPCRSTVFDQKIHPTYLGLTIKLIKLF